MPNKDDLKRPAASAARPSVSLPGTASPAASTAPKPGPTRPAAGHAQNAPTETKPAGKAATVRAKHASGPAVRAGRPADVMKETVPLAAPALAEPGAAPLAAQAPFAPKPERQANESVQSHRHRRPMQSRTEEPLRQMADVSLEQARDAFAAIKTSSDRLTRGVEASAEAGSRGIRMIGVTLFGAIQANTEAAFDYLRAMTEVKSMSTAVELQSRHARQQFESLTAQAKELTAVASTAAAETAEPLRQALGEILRKAS